MSLPVGLAFTLQIKFDDRPLRTPHLRRFSLIFKAAKEGKEELVVRGCLLPQGHKQVIPPSTLVSGKSYDICQMSPALQEAILNSFSFEDLFPVNQQRRDSLPEYLKERS